MEKNTLIIIFILFLISSKLWSIAWSIGKGLAFIVIIIVAINCVNPEVTKELQNILRKIISLDFNFANKYITDSAFKMREFLLSDLLKEKNDNELIVQEETL